MIRQAHTYLAGAVSGTALIAAAVVVFVLLVSFQAAQGLAARRASASAADDSVATGPSTPRLGLGGVGDGSRQRRCHGRTPSQPKALLERQWPQLPRGRTTRSRSTRRPRLPTGSPRPRKRRRRPAPAGARAAARPAVPPRPTGSASSAPAPGGGGGGGSSPSTGGGGSTGTSGGGGQTTSGAVTGTVNETVSGVDEAHRRRHRQHRRHRSHRRSRQRSRRPRIDGRRHRRRSRRNGRRPARRRQPATSRRSPPNRHNARLWRSVDRPGRLRTRSRARRSTRPGSRVNERGHLEIGGCDVVELAAEFGTPAYVYAEDDMRARARAYRAAFDRARRPTSRSSSPARRFPAPPPTGSSPRRASRSTSPPAASCTWRCAPASTPPGSTCTATTRATRRSSFAARCRRRPPDPRLLRRDRALRAAARTRRSEVLIRVTPGIKPSTHDYDRRPASSTRSSASGSRTGWRRGRSSACSPPTARAERPARPHRLADLRARALHAGDPGARRAGRRLVQDRQRRRRPRRRLHRARTSRPRSTPTSTSRCAASPRSSATACGSWSSRAARWSPTPASPPTGSAPSRRFPASAPTSPSTAACPTTCGRCSTALATKR